MDKEALAKLLDEPSEQRQETAESINQLVLERYGEPPLVLGVLQVHRPDLYISQGLKMLQRAVTLDAKTSELVAIGAASALRCEHYLRFLTERAQRLGVSQEQILEAMSIAGAVGEATIQAVALREYGSLPDAPPPGPAPRRRGRPRGYRDRQSFWDELVQEFRRRVPRATVSNANSLRVHSVRLGRGQHARLEWAFRRRREFSVQLVLNGSSEDNQARLEKLAGDQRALEKETGARLTFEGGRGRQSRVATRYRGSPQLNEAMRDWAAERMAQFYTTFRRRLSEIVLS